MSDKLAILICSASQSLPELLPTPLIHALAAQALDSELEIHFDGPALRLLAEGLAHRLFPTPAHEKSLGAFTNEVIAAGIPVFACGMARAAWLAGDDRPLAEAGQAGATAFVARTLDAGWRTQVY